MRMGQSIAGSIAPDTVGFIAESRLRLGRERETKRQRRTTQSLKLIKTAKILWRPQSDYYACIFFVSQCSPRHPRAKDRD